MIIDKDTLVVYLLSNDRYSRKYESDLINSINSGQKGIHSIAVSESEVKEDVATPIVLNGSVKRLPEHLMSIAAVLPAQIIGFYKSIQCGLSPDSPSLNGTITRTVEGVNIYSYQKDEILIPES